MDMLRRVKMEYKWTDLSWVKKDELFQTEVGKKRIQIWKDKQLLQWHVKWRDDISKQSGILLDRMIRTKDGEPFFICDKGWATIHDEVDEQFPSLGKESDWGKLIGSMLAIGFKKDECHRFQKKQPISLKDVKQQIDQLDAIDPMAKLVLERSYFEAKNRSKKKTQLLEKINTKKLPILLPFTTLSSAKQIFNHLYWVSDTKQPVQGYEPIRSILEAWHEKNGEKSTMLLLNQLNNNFQLTGEQGLFLLAELLEPKELAETVSDLSLREKNTSDVINTYFKSWETTRKLVILLSNWIEEETKKVVAK